MPMNRSSLTKFISAASGAFVLIAAVAFYTALPRGSEQPPSGPASAIGEVLSPTEGVRASENFQIADDSVEGDAGALGDLSPGGAASALEGDQLPVPAVQTNAIVERVVDGDTLQVRFDVGETATIRLLGVNTPETVDPRKTVECFGKEASAFSHDQLEGKLVRLDADPKADERDKYGRLLRNLTLENGTDFNAKLVAEGYAHAYLSFPLDPVRKKQLSDLEAAAKEAKKGLWGDACH